MKNLCIVCFTFLSVFCFGQSLEKTYQFKHLNTSDGLSQSSVIAMEQDRLGRMWLGTRDGLNVYDGTKFKVYRTVLNDSTSISNSDILSIMEDSEGFIWIGTYNGLNKYDPIKDTFERFYHFKDKNSLSNNTVWAIEEVANGDIWIGTSNGLSIYNKETDVFTSIYNESDSISDNGIPSNYVLSIKAANNGTIWVGTSKGFCKVIKDEALTIGFQQFNPTDYLEQPFVQTISDCGENSICVGTKNMGLLNFDLISERFLTNSYTIEHKDVRAVISAEEGLLWVGTSKGILLLNTNGILKNIAYEPEKQNGLSHNYIKSIFKDRKGSVWIGSYYGGIDIWDVSNTNFINYKESSGRHRLGHKVVSSIVSDTKGNLYFGTEGGGITVFDKQGKAPRYINTSNTDILQSDNIKSLFIDDNLLWAGTFNGGVEIFNIERNRFETNILSTVLDEILNTTGVYTIKKGLYDDYWFGTFGQGLVRYDLQKKTHEVFDHEPEVDKSISSNRIRSLMIDKGANVWVGTQSGLNLLPFSNGGYTSNRITRFFYDRETGSGDDILTIFQDTSGVVWVGIRAKGLFRFDGKQFQEIPLKTDVQVTSIYAILEDVDNTLWMSSNQGLLKYNTYEDSFVLYSEKDGLVGNEFSTGAALRPEPSKFYFGGPEGVSYFDSKTIAQNSYVPQVILTDLKVKNETVSVTNEDGILNQSMPFTKEITLDYNKANFSIDFTIPNFINPNSNRYQYRMVGLDENWTLTNQSKANYTIQRPGDYVFQVKGANNDGYWNTEPTIIKIQVLPAPWLSIWAKMLYGLLVLAALFGLISIIRSKTKLKHKLELEHLEHERNKELNDAKLRFFTNISHEFRTPLTLITGPLQQLLTDYKGSRVVYQKLLVIESSAKHLLQLINRLMDFRKLEHQKYKLETAEGNIVKFLKEIYLSFSEFAKGNGYEYTFETEQSKILVYYDRSKLEQVFYNLISNAFKYTPYGGKITIQIKKDGESVLIDIKDSGRGIPEQYRHKVFDRFFEIPDFAKDENTQGTGTGIGLSIAKSIVELHKGDISIIDQNIPGSTFRVTLKLGRHHITDDEIIKDFKFSDDLGLYTSQLKQKLSDLSIKSNELLMNEEREVVLIVEDNVPLRNFIKDILQDTYNVVEAGDGKEALEKALKYIPSLIVSDVIMPVMVGTELCAKIKENIQTSHIPVILLTSRTSLLYKFEGLESGADDYISKPFDIKEFKLRIKNLIDSTNRLKSKFSDDKGLTPNEIVISSIDEKLLKKALKIVEDNISNDQFDIITFGTELGVSRTLLFTKIKAWTNFTPNEFIQEIRMKRAVQLLEQGNLTIAEIGYQVGFKNPKYFSKCFLKKFGLSPSAYLKKFSQEFFDLN
ncbi:response regulator [Flagellimonas sp. 389]|uniref:hybrid sensor histidine kinase/response regulator transcription factor n=1 Tax=Flagellimonas sp. 389 TaxID=2835862 RepID=UPI001BD65D26|nr:two-component regulator propeller domain-containing protein [Flagellimonas sp. 389]MBS9461838.1 response regulator [Flagellimonas sp. 389]